MKIIILIVLFCLFNQQDIVKVQDQCSCESLLNQSDCDLKRECTWNTIANTPFCSKFIQLQYESFCQTIINKISNCAKTLGCAYYNSTCIQFSGCQSYYFKSTSACQSVSSRCISDGNQCVDIKNCINYQTERQCNNFPSSSGARSCKWIDKKCQDKQCRDAPQNYNTNNLCIKWMPNCISTGQGCTDVLQPCSSYKKSNGCNQLVGIDGNCMDSWNDQCRAANCQDAPSSFNSNQQCSLFKNGCLTTGKGCADQLMQCQGYNKQIGCKGLIGIDGPCTNSPEVYRQNCKILECTDAPLKLSTNKDCNQFLNGCITNGRGCVNTLQQCSKYLGTKTICQLYIGIEGYCDGIDAKISNCKKRLCEDALIYYSLNDNTCNNFQIGCVSNGFNCVQKLSPCNEYYGTSTQCDNYKGQDGNCGSDNQLASNCRVKDCSKANYQTNKQCEDYSYTCITNGYSCILPQQCEVILEDRACQFNPACQSAVVCVDMTDCVNFITMSLCQQNVQNYKSGNSIYRRQCKQNQVSQICTNQKCSDIKSICTSDQQCSEILSGCITNGQGAIDISEPCSSYWGNTQTCLQFKGINGSVKCSQQIGNEGNCQTITYCQQANQFFIGQLTESICQNLLTGCSFDGKDNCVIGDCTSFYGTQYTCSLINTAISQGQQQPCWKVIEPSNQSTNCEPRQCSHAVPSSLSPFNSNYLCQLFLKSCYWNGLQSGGCVSQGQCSSYQGTLQSCQQYTDGVNSCTKKGSFCRPIICENKTVPTTLSNLQDKASFCQQIINENGFNCILSQSNQTQCQTPTSDGIANCQSYVALTNQGQTQQSYCQSLTHSYKGITCIYKENSYCDVGICTNIFIGDKSDDQKATYCQSKIDSDKNKCGIQFLSQAMCSIQQCQDILTSYDQYKCQSYADGSCRYHNYLKICYKQQAQCSDYFFPVTSEIQKVMYCRHIIQNYSTNSKCCYEPSTSSSTCFLAQTCDQMNLQSLSLTFEEKLQFCSNQIMENGSSCVYDKQNNENLCSGKKTNCNDYQIPTASKLSNQIFCQSLYNSASQQCAYLDGNSNCVDYNFDCSSYLTFGENIQQNLELCSQLKWNNQSQCQYSSGPTCIQIDCSQIQSPNLVNCNKWNCVFDGLICFKKMNDCSGYLARDQGLGKQSNCSQLQDLNNNQCGYSNGNNCSIKGCDNQIANPNQDTCASYYQCSFNGNSCYNYQGSCPVYIPGYLPYDQNYDKNAKFCNSLIDFSGFTCTFYVEQVACIAALKLCTDYFIGNKSLASTVCQYLQDSNLKPCSYESGDYCSYKQCSQSNLAISDQDCAIFMKGCESDSTANCSSANCSDSPNYNDDARCQQFKKGCLTNGKGCIDQSEPCSQYKGTKLICKRFKGVNGTFHCDNYDFAVEVSPCINRFCELNTIATSQADCTSFYPLNGGKYCVWNGILGCKQPSKCNDFTGTADSCPTFTATDGPCYGYGSNKNPQQCLPNECLKAPKSYITNQQCQQWHSDCITNGFGCIFNNIYPQCSQMLTRNSCLEQQLAGCGIAQQCKTIQKKCQDFKTGYECNNYLLNGQQSITCAWNPSTNQCGELICELLPVTLITDISCNSALSGCITNGAGCMNIGLCSSYNRMSCNGALTIEVQKKCIWADSLCRPIQCTDNLVSKSDVECDNYLSGCRTPGLGCASVIQCSDFISAKYCLQDSSGNSCLWYVQNSERGNCIKFTQCSDLAGQTHNQCQIVSSLCTTNGSFCVPLTKCQDFTLQISCVKGIDGICGWKQQSCQLYTKCEDSITNCQEWGNQCTYDKLLGYCRLSKCEDKQNNINFSQLTTYSECQNFSKNCTTNGTSCTQITSCSSYKTQVNCQYGTDGQCNWIESKQICKVNECIDWSLSQCTKNQNGLDCVSNSTSCIPKNNCSSYNYLNACWAGGTDGLCVFTETNSQGFFGTCTKFVECQQALSNKTLCNIRSDSCYFNQNTSLCQTKTCNHTTVANCQPIPSFDLSQYQICILSGINCINGSPTQINASSLCYQSSAQTYTWNPKTQQCTQCVQAITNNITENQTTAQLSQNFIILGLLFYIQFM